MSPGSRFSWVLLVVVALVTVLFIGGGFVYYVRQWRSAKAQSASPLLEPLPRDAVAVRCTATLAGFGADGGRHRDRVVLSDDVLHLALRGGIRASIPRPSVIALRSQPFPGSLSVDVQHTGHGLVGPPGPMAFWGKRTEVESFLAQASLQGWPVLRE